MPPDWLAMLDTLTPAFQECPAMTIPEIPEPFFCDPVAMASVGPSLHIHTVDPLLVWLGVIVAGGAVGGYSLYMRDLIRRGRLHRRTEKLIAEGAVSLLPAGRVACPECAEAILPAARRCPYCRSVVVGRI